MLLSLLFPIANGNQALKALPEGAGAASKFALHDAITDKAGKDGTIFAAELANVARDIAATQAAAPAGATVKAMAAGFEAPAGGEDNSLQDMLASTWISANQMNPANAPAQQAQVFQAGIGAESWTERTLPHLPHNLPAAITPESWPSMLPDGPAADPILSNLPQAAPAAHAFSRIESMLDARSQRMIEVGERLEAALSRLEAVFGDRAGYSAGTVAGWLQAGNRAEIMAQPESMAAPSRPAQGFLNAGSIFNLPSSSGGSELLLPAGMPAATPEQHGAEARQAILVQAELTRGAVVTDAERAAPLLSAFAGEEAKTRHDPGLPPELKSAFSAKPSHDGLPNAPDRTASPSQPNAQPLLTPEPAPQAPVHTNQASAPVQQAATPQPAAEPAQQASTPANQSSAPAQQAATPQPSPVAAQPLAVIEPVAQNPLPENARAPEHAAMPRAEAAPETQSSRATHLSFTPPPPAARAAIIADMALTMSRRFDSGESRFQIRLDPPELGRLDIRMAIEASGRVQTMIMAERPETLDMLRADARALERALADAGLKTDQGSLNFSLRDQGSGNGGLAHEGLHDEPALYAHDAAQDARAAAEDEQISLAGLSIGGRTGVDIRI